MFKLGVPVFTEEVPTAAVEFDKVGECINFYINPDFWANCSLQKKLFVISHECLHVLFYHGIRASLIDDEEQMKLANKAMDVVVNHALADSFAFDRDVVDPAGEYCWVDTLWPNRNDIPVGKSFEYYFNLLKTDPQSKKKSGGGQGAGKGKLVDEHGFLKSFNNKKFEEQVQDIINNYDAENVEKLVAEETKDIQNDIKQAGLNPGQLTKIATYVKRQIKHKWEEVIKRWSKKFNFDKEMEQWIRKNRRFHSLPSELMLPSEQEVEFEEKNRIDVWFFMDTSGSCVHLADRFFKAATTLDPNRFDVKLFCFDTKVYETDLKSRKLFGFGGTSFGIIERYIQNKIKDKKYPSAIFMVTDGMGDSVQPAFPDRWHIFLSYNYRDCFPQDVNFYNLADYE